MSFTYDLSNIHIKLESWPHQLPKKIIACCQLVAHISTISNYFHAKTFFVCGSFVTNLSKLLFLLFHLFPLLLSSFLS